MSSCVRAGFLLALIVAGWWTPAQAAHRRLDRPWAAPEQSTLSQITSSYSDFDDDDGHQHEVSLDAAGPACHPLSVIAIVPGDSFDQGASQTPAAGILGRNCQSNC